MPSTKIIRAGLRRSAKVQHLVSLSLTVALMLVTFGAWTIASPVGSSPDEDFHIASVWCGQGERDGICEPGSSATSRLVPDKAERSVCFAQQGTYSGACQGEGFEESGFVLVETSRLNVDGMYPEGFYAFGSVFAGENMTASVLTMRFFNATLFCVALILLWHLLPHRYRNPLLGGLTITFVPLGMFMIPSINPSSWAITSSALMFPALVAYFNAPRRQAIALGIFAAAMVVIGFMARADSAVFVVVAISAAAVLGYRNTRGYFLRLLLPVAFLLLSLHNLGASRQAGAAIGGGMTFDDVGVISPSSLIINNILDLPELVFGVLGLNFDSSPHSGLGALDVPLPGLVWGATISVFAGVVFNMLHRVKWRRGLALIGAGSALVVVPLVILQQSSVSVGWQVQPRYIMPLLVIFATAALMPSGVHPNEDSPIHGVSEFQWWIIATLLTVANSVALIVTIRRYAFPEKLRLLQNWDWWWQSGPPPAVVWVIGSVAFAGLAACTVFAMKRNAKLMQITSAS